MALGALGELRRRGLDVPGRVAVAGFGGVVAAADANPTLTTIELPLAQMAGRAVEWVLEGASTATRAADGQSGSGLAAGADAAGVDVADAAAREVHVRGDVQLRESTALAAGD